MKQITNISKLRNILGYQFNQTSLLQDALTHRSASSKNNERLEFLGDSILNFVIAAELYHSYPKLAEGDLSRIRASLVKKEGLAMIAHDLDLGDYLTLGSGELKSGGFRRDSILSDAVEAIFGAVYLDGGFDASRDLILRLYHQQLNNVPDPELLKDPKTRLQELLQSRKYAVPKYEIISASGQSHNQIFNVSCIIDDLSVSTQGKASSRRKAEQLAAAEAVTQIEILMKQTKKVNG